MEIFNSLNSENISTRISFITNYYTIWTKFAMSSSFAFESRAIEKISVINNVAASFRDITSFSLDQKNHRIINRCIIV